MDYSRLHDAVQASLVLNAPSERRVEVHRRIVAGLTDLYARKNHDYGNSFAVVRAKRKDSILIRLEDKLMRIEELMKSEAKVEDESVEDTLRDLANYAIMELVERQIEREAGTQAKSLMSAVQRVDLTPVNGESKAGGDSV